ncbi:alpha/beta fold hydrolase [Streptomyces sp. Ag109_O5-1]|uniref:alpha/beta fold hydrolase n=1 Tax=Streptomyces sp. Ag109_O5-1 TaxID=1938851 RepID=UPI0037D9F70A
MCCRLVRRVCGCHLVTVRTHVLKAGSTEHPALVLVHGAGQGGRMCRHQLTALSDDLHIVAPDLPGFGGTPGPYDPAPSRSLTGLNPGVRFERRPPETGRALQRLAVGPRGCDARATHR